MTVHHDACSHAGTECDAYQVGIVAPFAIETHAQGEAVAVVVYRHGHVKLFLQNLLEMHLFPGRDVGYIIYYSACGVHDRGYTDTDAIYFGEHHLLDELRELRNDHFGIFSCFTRYRFLVEADAVVHQGYAQIGSTQIY